VISVGKDCWLTVRVSEKIARIVRTTADLMGLSVSELLRQAILEKLERMNLIGSEIKAVLSRIEGDSDGEEVKKCR